MWAPYSKWIHAGKKSLEKKRNYLRSSRSFKVCLVSKLESASGSSFASCSLALLLQQQPQPTRLHFSLWLRIFLSSRFLSTFGQSYFFLVIAVPPPFFLVCQLFLFCIFFGEAFLFFRGKLSRSNQFLPGAQAITKVSPSRKKLHLIFSKPT